MSFLKCRFRFLKPNFNREFAGRSGPEEQPDQPAWFTNETAFTAAQRPP